MHIGSNVCLDTGKWNCIKNRPKTTLNLKNTKNINYLMTNAKDKDNKVKYQAIFSAKIPRFLSTISPGFSIKSNRSKFNLEG